MSQQVMNVTRSLKIITLSLRQTSSVRTRENIKPGFNFITFPRSHSVLINKLSIRPCLVVNPSSLSSGVLLPPRPPDLHHANDEED